MAWRTLSPLKAGATASRDGACARRHGAWAGRDEETVLRSNQETDLTEADNSCAHLVLTMPRPARDGHFAPVRREGQRLVIEPAPPKSLLALLATLGPIDEDFPPIDDAPLGLLQRLRAFRGRLPEDFTFDRDEANAR